MKHNILSCFLVAMLGLVSSACSNDDMTDINPVANGKTAMSFTFSHPSLTRATETSFESGDRVGLFLNPAGEKLEISGNTVNNEMFSFDGQNWKGVHTLYWDKGNYDSFAYYPFIEDVTSVSDLPFSVKLNQNIKDEESGLDGFEASDFLYASNKGIAASADPVNMKFRHILSKLTIRLIKGEDFEGDFPEKPVVYLHNTVPYSTIDLNAGIATREVKGAKKTIIAKQTSATSFSVITIPQRIENRMPLIEVVMNGVSFLYESKFLFKPGINHLVNLVIDKNPEQIKIEIGGEIVDWN